MVNKVMLSGRAGSGKSKLAKYLVEEHDFVELAFSDGIYQIAEEFFGMEVKERWLLQEIGQKLREIDPLIWVNHTFSRAKEHDKVVISDVRQENEYTEGIEKGYLPIRINADLDIRVLRLLERDGELPDLGLLENDSETGADDCEFIDVFNNGEIEVLFEQVDLLIANSENLEEFLSGH